jgi:hypothetical protein
MAQPAQPPTPGEDHRAGDADYVKIPAWFTDAMKTPSWHATLGETVKTPAWQTMFGETAKTAARMQTLLGETAKTPAWQAAFGDALKSPTWAQTAASLVELVEAPEWLAESFKAPESTESIQPLPDDSAVPSVASKIRQVLLLTAAIYIASAMALHLSNAISVKDPVFDLHQFLTYEFIAMSLALAFYSAFPKD